MMPPVTMVRSPIPTMVRVASLLWIIFGSQTALTAVGMMFWSWDLFYSPQTNDVMIEMVLTLGTALGCLGLFGLMFVRDGLRLLRGQGKRLRETSICSLIFGLLWFGCHVPALWQPTERATLVSQGEQFFFMAVTYMQTLGGAALVVAGILALRATGQYRAWQAKGSPPA